MFWIPSVVIKKTADVCTTFTLHTVCLSNKNLIMCQQVMTEIKQAAMHIKLLNHQYLFIFLSTKMCLIT